jgi:hypothetical protein
MPTSPSVVPMPEQSAGHAQSGTSWTPPQCSRCKSTNVFTQHAANALICRDCGKCTFPGDEETESAEAPSNGGAGPNGAHAGPEPEAEKSNHNLGVALAAAGLRIFPVHVYFDKQKRKWEKIPRVKDWENGASTNPNQIREWWKQWPGSCPGIALKHAGLVAIDADRHRFDEDGVAALQALQAKYRELPDHPVCLTAGDGEHHIFRQMPGITLGTSRGNLPPGIDVRGVGGLIIAPGSRRADGKLWRAPGFLKAYEAGTIPTVPDWLALIIQPPAPKSSKQKNNGASHSGGGEAPPNELANVKSALPFISADDRKNWFDVGAALHWTGWTCARELFDEWSRTSLKFDAADQDKTWRSFGRGYKGKPKTIASLFQMAMVAGWLHPGRAAPPNPNKLPELVVSGSDPTVAAKELARLIAERDDFLFNGNAPVYVAAEAGNMPRAIVVKVETVRILAHEICVPVKRIKKGDSAAIALSEDIAGLYLRGLEGSWGLKPFNGITTAPILAGDGSIRIAEGYDPASGMWCHEVPVVDVADKPTRTDAEDALYYIRHTFRTFPFADGARVFDDDLGLEVIDTAKPAGLDESSFLAMLMTGVCRQSLETAPGLLCDAPSLSGAGTGKGLLVKAICVIASGARPAAFTSGHDSGELDKRLSAALVEARPAVFLDNFNAKELASDILASVLTENPAMVRVMGRTKNVPLNVRTFIGITGNAVEIAEDMARRIIKVGLDAKMESPEERKFKPGFLEDILAARTDLLSAALTIWRWGRQNKMKEGRPLGSFEVWCQWCRDPLLTLGMQDPVTRIAEIKANDPRRRALVEIFDAWFAEATTTSR